MKALLSILSILLLTQCHYDSFIINGTYQGRNLKLSHPKGDGKIGPCIKSWSVNGEAVKTQKFSSTIDLTNFPLQIGESISIEITHPTKCKPIIMNPEVLLPKSTYQIMKVELLSDDTLMWQTTRETGPLLFYIEQNNPVGWETIDSIQGIGKPELQTYQLKLSPFNGTRKIRFYQIDYTHRRIESNLFEVN